MPYNRGEPVPGRQKAKGKRQKAEVKALRYGCLRRIGPTPFALFSFETLEEEEAWNEAASRRIEYGGGTLCMD